jgi:hypothetical protein
VTSRRRTLHPSRQVRPPIRSFLPQSPFRRSLEGRRTRRGARNLCRTFPAPPHSEPSVPNLPGEHRPFAGSVANFAQEELKGQLSLSVRGLCGQGVELFGRGEALLDAVVQLPFSQHVHQFDADESGLSRVKRCEP